MQIKIKGSLLCLMLLLSTIAILSETSCSSLSAGPITIRATVIPSVCVSTPADIRIWELKPSGPGVYTKKGVIRVSANSRWKISVKNAGDINDGHMIEWAGTTFSSRKTQATLRVSADREVALPDGGPIQTGTIADDQEVPVTLTQMVSQNDLPLEDGHVYRIALSFEGSPMD